MDINKAYAALQKKYRLPHFEALDRDFEIGSIEESHFLLREIRKKLGEKLEAVRGLLEEVLNPDTSMAGIYESRTFSEHEKKDIFDVYRKLMIMHRRVVELSLLNEDAADAAFVKEMTAAWEKLKKDLAAITRKLQGSWEKDMEEDEKLGYFG